MASVTLNVPEIHCEHCIAAIEGALAPLDGVDDVVVDLASTTVRVDHDDELSVRRIVEAIEDQGYDVPEQDARVES